VSPAGFVHEIGRDLELGKDLAQPPNVVAYLLGEKRVVVPGLAEDLRGREEPVWMPDQELQELELSLGQHDLPALMSQDPAVGVQPEALKLPHSCVPEVQALL